MARLWLLFLSILAISCADPPPARAPEPPKRPAEKVVVEVPTPTSEQVPVHEDDPSLGPKVAPLTIVMFSDFQCPFCSRVEPTLKLLRERYGSALRLVWKDLPLSMHKYAREAAVIARVAFLSRGNDAFWHLHDKFFENQHEINEQNMLAWASEVGIDGGTIASYREQAESLVDRSIAESKTLMVGGTPHFLVDGQMIGGAQKPEKFSAILNAHLAKAKELSDQGVAPGDMYAALVKTYWTAPAPEEEEPEPPIDPTVWAAPIAGAPSKGPKDALVTLVVFGDFQCPFCKKLDATLTQLDKDYAGKLRFVWKDQPLSFHARAIPAANAAREVRKQKGDEAFFKYVAALFASQPKLEDGDLEDAAASIPGVDVKKVRLAIEKDLYRAEIDKDIDDAESLEVSGTPHVFVNGRSLGGSQPLAKWKGLVDEEMAKAKAKVSAGTSADKVYAETTKGGKYRGPVDLKIPADAPFRGGAKAKVVLQVFSDFECPHCRRFARKIEGNDHSGMLEEIEKKYGDKIKIVWRDYPLAFHKRARAAATFAREVKKQKGMATFWKVHDELFDLGGALEDDKLAEIAKKYGVDWAKAKDAIAKGAHDAAIDADQKAASDAAVTGTPATLINGRLYSGAQAVDAWIRAIDRALSRK